MDYKLKTPCAQCPFRDDIRPFLTTGRAEEITDSLVRAEFPCHKTLDYSRDGVHGDAGAEIEGTTQHCAGALIMLERMEQPSQMMRIAERLGVYDRTTLAMDAPVFDDAEAFIDAQE